MTPISMLDLRKEYEFMQADIDDAIKRCLQSQRWILGPEVKEFEDRCAQYLSSNHCLGVSSGTDALVVALRGLAIKLTGNEYFSKTDKIITTPFTFTATGDAILRSGATPVFVDIDPLTFNIDPQKVKNYLQSNSGVVGLMPVHLYGQACAMDELTQIAKEHQLFVVEDVAQAFGAKWDEKHLGTRSDIGAFSFFPSKNLGGFGDGGLLATDDQELFDLMTMLRKHGGKDKYNVDHIGYNARLDALQAAILKAKLQHIDELNQRRRKTAQIYLALLKDVEILELPQTMSEKAFHVYHQFTVRLKNKDRGKFINFLKEHGISTMVYYPFLLNTMKVFENRCEIGSNLTQAKQAAEEVVSLPVGPFLSEKEIQYVCEKIIEYS